MLRMRCASSSIKCWFQIIKITRVFFCIEVASKYMNFILNCSELLQFVFALDTGIYWVLCPRACLNKHGFINYLFQVIMVEVETTMILAITVDNSSLTMVPWKVVAALVAEVQAVPMVVSMILYRKYFWVKIPCTCISIYTLVFL